MLTSTKKYGLTPEEKAFYDDGGYLLAKAVFTRAEAALLREEAHQIARRLQANQTAGVVNQGWGAGAKVTELPRQLLHCHNVQFHSAILARLLTDPRLTDRACSLSFSSATIEREMPARPVRSCCSRPLA